ncbi:MAG: MotA/TolQ/ExbB proton channel family protein [Pseudomonadota bacterium]
MIDLAVIDLGQILHVVVDHLLLPVIAALLVLTFFITIDIGIVLGERFGGLARLKDKPVLDVEGLARARISRADLATRLGPSLGLMGTLIPLGPGISAMGRGDFQTLATAITTAFDTTVLGLVIGISGFLIGRWRRIAYDRLLSEIEVAHA